MFSGGKLLKSFSSQFDSMFISLTQRILELFNLSLDRHKVVKLMIKYSENVFQYLKQRFIDFFSINFLGQSITFSYK